MKFLNSNYGYANFAKGALGQNAPSNTRADSSPSKKKAKLGNGYSSKNPAMGRGDFAPSVFANEVGPQPLYGPQPKQTKAGKMLGQIENKAQGLRAKANNATLKAKDFGSNALKKAGKFVKKNKVAVGLAAAGALGAAGYGVYRKMRSDKGKKRGSYD